MQVALPINSLLTIDYDHSTTTSAKWTCEFNNRAQIALGRAYTSAKAADVAKLLLLSKHISSQAEYSAAPPNPNLNVRWYR